MSVAACLPITVTADWSTAYPSLSTPACIPKTYFANAHIPVLALPSQSVGDNFFAIHCCTAQLARYECNLARADIGGRESRLNHDDRDDRLIA